MRPLSRSAVLHGYAQLATSTGLDVDALLARAGLEAADLASPDRWVNASAVARLLDASAVAAGREDFGLQLAQWRRLSTIGPLSIVLREEPDLRSALELLMRYEHTYSEAVRIRLSEADGVGTVQVWFELGEPVPVRQVLDLAVAALLDGLRWLRGEQWQPLAVCFVHPAPADPAEHRRLLGPALRFEQRFDGLVLHSADLDSPNALADPADPGLRTYTRQFLLTLPPPAAHDPGDRVRELVTALLPLRRCSMSQVARGLGMSKRTLHRHLAAQGDSFAAIVDDVRAGLAERYLDDPRYAVADIADQLGFAAPSAFSRWCRRRFGVSPTAWRAAVDPGAASSAQLAG
ncbi:AraC family transcriptional regulator [Blastococcus sp. SYSU D00669]